LTGKGRLRKTTAKAEDQKEKRKGAKGSLTREKKKRGKSFAILGKGKKERRERTEKFL